jgi:hypothetical protein
VNQPPPFLKGVDIMALFDDLEAYKQLNDIEKMIFRNMFETLLFNDAIRWSDRQLSNYYHISLSQWEKVLRKFCDLELLERNNIKQRENGKWKTVARQITLSPKSFPFTSLTDFNNKYQKIQEMLKYLGGGKNGFIDASAKSD